MPWTEQGTGWKGTDTSEEAAQSVRAPELRGLVLRHLRGGGSQTTEEIAEAVGKPYESIQPRLSELRDKGLVYDTGERGISRYGKRIIKWAATPSRTLTPEAETYRSLLGLDIN